MAQFDPNKPYEAAQQGQDSSAVHASGFDPNKPYDAAGSLSDPPKEEGFLSRTWNKVKKVAGDADEAITESMAPSPKNLTGPRARGLAALDTVMPLADPEVAKTLGREVYEGGKSILGMVPGAYHAIADDPTAEESAAFGGDRGKIVASRVTGVTPAVEAGMTYADPKTRPTVDQALSVLPEAFGQGAGTVVGGKLGEVVAPKVVEGAKRLSPVISGDESFIGKQKNYNGNTKGVVGNDFVPKQKTPVGQTKSGLTRVPYPDPESVVQPKETPALVGNDYTEGTPGELGKAKPSRATVRSPYAEPTPFEPKEEGLVGNEHAEPVEPAMFGKPAPETSSAASRAFGKVPYAEPTALAPVSPEEGLVGNEYTEGSKPLNAGKPSRGLQRVPYADPTDFVKDISKEDVKSSPGTSMSEEPKKYAGEERRAVERKAPLNAVEMEDAIKNRKPFQTPFDVTEGSMDTIKNDPNMPKHAAEEAKAVAAKSVDKENEWYNQAKKELGEDNPGIAKRAQELKEEATKGEETSADRFTDKQKAEMKGYGLTDEEIEKLEKAKSARAKEPELKNNASGESAASQEALNREESNKRQGIKLYKVKVNGEEVPLHGPDSVDVKAEKGETIVKRYADGHEEIQDQGQGAKYSGPKEVNSKDLHSGVKEQVSNLTNNDLKALGEKYGLKSEDYDFKRRDKSTREGSSNTYPVERIKFIEDLMSKMPEDEKLELGRQIENGFEGETFKDVDRSQKGRAERAATFFPKLRELTEKK